MSVTRRSRSGVRYSLSQSVNFSINFTDVTLANEDFTDVTLVSEVTYEHDDPDYPNDHKNIENLYISCVDVLPQLN